MPRFVDESFRYEEKAVESLKAAADSAFGSNEEVYYLKQAQVFATLALQQATLATTIGSD